MQPAVRTIYPKMVNSRQLTPLFSLDASAQEIIWIAGPVVVTFVATQISRRSASWCPSSSWWAAGSGSCSRPRSGGCASRAAAALGVVLTRGPVLLATLVGFLLIGSCAAIEAGVVADVRPGQLDLRRRARDLVGRRRWSAASLSATCRSAPGRSPGGWSSCFGSALSVVAILVWAGTPASFWTLSGALVVAGLGIAPALAVMFAVVSSSVRFSDTAEAYGWVGTGQLIGAAAGSAVAGFLIDFVSGRHAGSPGFGGFLVAVAFAVVGTLVPVLFRRRLPDLRGRDASPIADTEPVPAQPS